MLRHRLCMLFVAVVALPLFSCTDSTVPNAEETRDPTDLRLLTTPHGTPQLVTSQLSFWAVQGRATTAEIWYRPRPGVSDSSRFLVFQLGANSLASRPDGTAITPGDSVLITLTVTDQSHFLVDFQPSGLKFSPSDQPTLKISFAVRPALRATHVPG